MSIEESLLIKVPHSLHITPSFPILLGCKGPSDHLVVCLSPLSFPNKYLWLRSYIIKMLRSTIQKSVNHYAS